VKLISEGRASQIFDLGDGRVLRRHKRGGNPDREADIMRLARSHGFPAPQVHEIRSDGLVLERVDGPTMHAALTSTPCGDLRAAATELLRLHTQLHAISRRPGVALVHGDLHWKNVLSAPSGPVVIDWANAGWGDPALDVALTWVILATSSGPTGRLLAHAFARIADVEPGRNTAIRRRLADASLTRAERRLVTALRMMGGRRRSRAIAAQGWSTARRSQRSARGSDARA
jgi:tRNA A-37 threonylcarbamoyl transferase component Bud32